MSGQKVLVFVSALTLALNLFGQNFTSGARSAGMGGASVTFRDVHSLFSNQAGLSNMEKVGVVAFVEQRFLTPELRTFGAGAALPTRSGTFGLSVQQFGFEEFRQQKFGLAYARKFLDNLSIGAQFDYFTTQIKEYGSKGLLTFEAGLIIQISKQLIIGTHIFSPARVEFGVSESLPAIYRAGLSYMPSGKAILSVELEKDIDFPVRFKGGIEYQAAEPLYVRVGIGSAPNSASFGIGLQLKSGFRIDIASCYHQTLGLTPVAGISYQR